MSGSQTDAPPARLRLETIGAIVVSGLVLVAYGTALVLACLGRLPATQPVTLLLGSVVSLAGTIVSYWVGSSIGSKAKDVQIATQSAQLAASVPASAVVVPFRPPATGGGASP